MSNNAELINQSLIGAFGYFGLQEMQIDKVNYYLIHTGCNHPLWNMIVLPDKVNRLFRIYCGVEKKGDIGYNVDGKYIILNNSCKNVQFHPSFRYRFLENNCSNH